MYERVHHKTSNIRATTLKCGEPNLRLQWSQSVIYTATQSPKQQFPVSSIQFPVTATSIAPSKLRSAPLNSQQYVHTHSKLKPCNPAPTHLLSSCSCPPPPTGPSRRRSKPPPPSSLRLLCWPGSGGTGEARPRLRSPPPAVGGGGDASATSVMAGARRDPCYGTLCPLIWRNSSRVGLRFGARGGGGGGRSNGRKRGADGGAATASSGGKEERRRWDGPMGTRWTCSGGCVLRVGSGLTCPVRLLGGTGRSVA